MRPHSLQLSVRFRRRPVLSDKEPFGYTGNGGKYFLLDPVTGKLQAVKGEFRPLRTSESMLLQPTGKPNEVWSPLYDLEKGDCFIGRYNLATFSFTPVINLSGLRLSRMEMWVDEAAGKIYFIHDGNLLRVPLPK